MSTKPRHDDPAAAIALRLDALTHALRAHRPRFHATEIGCVLAVGQGVAELDGLPGVAVDEIVRLGAGASGIVLDLRENTIGVALLDEAGGVAAGDQARRSGRVLDVPVGDALLGRVVDPLGRPLDGHGPLGTTGRAEVERDAPAILDRAPVTAPLETGLIVVDALVPIGRGQRELVIGDRQTGKSSLAVDTIVRQRDRGVVAIYCAIGERAAAVAGVLADLRRHGALRHTVVVSTTEQDPPALRFVAPYAAMTMAEHFRDRGEDALVVFDDMTRHARAYREISLLLRRPPGREAYPADIFFIHARLLERSTHLREGLGGGSLTALPIVETEAGDIAAYIPTNLISITDGQVLLAADRFQKGVLPAVDVGRSVSRVGGKSQFPAYRAVAGDLRLAYAQFEELERFARFATRLDEPTRRTVERGQRMREILKQPRHSPISIPEQVAMVLALVEGLFDEVALGDVGAAAARVSRAFRARHGALARAIEAGAPLDRDMRSTLLATAAGEIGAAGAPPTD
jgi:F-type H+/Na+-transporting ATPase subunit alpha